MSILSRLRRHCQPDSGRRPLFRGATLLMCMLMLVSPDMSAAMQIAARQTEAGLEQEAAQQPEIQQAEVLSEEETFQEELSGQDEKEALMNADREAIEIGDDYTDGPQTVVVADDSPYGLDGRKIFSPDPSRAVWLSALFPGLGQVYNRRYWKLPIVIGGFMGLAYATSWNNNQYNDYSQAYRDISDSDPTTDSYMNFFPPTTQESDLDKAWLTSVMQNRKNYYRRNRDLCIICIVGLYLLCLVDAYVDASMAHFDISPDLSLDMTPAIMVNPQDRRYSLGLNWAFTF